MRVADDTKHRQNPGTKAPGGGALDRAAIVLLPDSSGHGPCLKKSSRIAVQPGVGHNAQ